MADMQIFRNTEFGSVRTVTGADGEVWFVGKDVCDCLGLGNPTESLKALDEDERNTLRISEGGPQRNIISESGLYSLVIRSRKPEAKKFKKWVTSEVLPSIRKHGAYATPGTLEKMLSDPDTMIKTLQALKAEQEKRRQLEAKVNQDKPKVTFADSVDASHTSILIGDLAKLIKQNGVEMGQNRLFGWMRENGYLIKGGDSRNMPTQKAMEIGLFEVKERTIGNPDGSVRITKTTKVPGKGQIYFCNKFLG